MYTYETERTAIFTEDGQKTFLKVRDAAVELIRSAGCVSMGAVWDKVMGDAWFVMACLDRLVELGEIKEITNDSVAGQHRIFVSLK